MLTKEPGWDEPTLSKECIFQGYVFDVEKHHVALREGRTSTREMVCHRGGVAVLALDEAGAVYLVRQFRKPVGDYVLEIPAGKLEAGEDPDEAIRRELCEETGLTAAYWEKLLVTYPTPGYSTEQIHLYLAKDLSAGEACPDPGEYLDLVRLPFEEALAAVRRGEIQDGKTLITLLLMADRMRCGGGCS